MIFKIKCGDDTEFFSTKKLQRILYCKETEELAIDYKNNGYTIDFSGKANSMDVVEEISKQLIKSK